VLPLISVGGRIEVTRRTLATSFPQVTMTSPDGSTKTITLNQTSPGLGLGVIDVDKPGLYRFVRATEVKLKPLVEASGGGLMWLADNPDPDIRSVRPGRTAGGSDWIGLRRNEGYTVAGINQLPLLRGILVALAFLMAIGSAWWREGVVAGFPTFPPCPPISRVRQGGLIFPALPTFTPNDHG
jgi:hypothetical protein